MFLDNLRLIWSNGNFLHNLKLSLWARKENAGYGEFVGMLAYVYEMADCYIASEIEFESKVTAK